jgi:HdeA/HdeB family
MAKRVRLSSFTGIKRKAVMTRILAAIAASVVFTAPSIATAQVPLTSYADAKGFIDVQTLTCAQLAGTFQEDADLLSAWYSGLAKKHYVDLKRGKVVEHEVIVYCKANPEKKIIEALAVVFKDERANQGVDMK